ncbi:MAG: hypothetical protein IJK35_08860 [Oscillospiraceae bacterium]|nr:hypothetical protein [Oscillospiraceae bacterium]
MSARVLIINFICYAMWFAAIHLLAQARLRTAVAALIEAFVFIPYFFITTSVTENMTAPRLLLGLGIIALTVLLLHRGKWYDKLLLVFLVMLMMLLSEYLTAVIIPADLLSAGISGGAYGFQLAYYALYLFIQAVFLSVLVMVGRALQRRRADHAASGLSLMFLLFPFSQLLLLAGYFVPMSSGGVLVRPIYIFLAVLLCAAADVGLAFAMYTVSRAADLRSKKRALEQTISDQGAYYAAVAAHYEQVRRLRHDLDNHLYTIRILLDDGKTAEAAQYAAELSRTEQSALQAEVDDV